VSFGVPDNKVGVGGVPQLVLTRTSVSTNQEALYLAEMKRDRNELKHRKKTEVKALEEDSAQLVVRTRKLAGRTLLFRVLWTRQDPSVLGVLQAVKSTKRQNESTKRALKRIA
jgi:hypothetical protein